MFAYLSLFGPPPVTILMLPIVVLPLLLFVMGLSWALASLGVFLRDVAQIMSIATTVLMFLSPIFYNTSSLPPEYRPVLQLNPLTPVIEQVRDVLFWGKMPDLGFLALYLLCAAAIAWVGFAWFQKTRKGFADVL